MAPKQEEQKRLDAEKSAREKKLHLIYEARDRAREENRKTRRKKLRSMDVQQLLAELLIHIEEHGIDINSY